MISVLDQLVRRPGVAGALVATEDGMVVVARLRPELDADAASALVATVAREVGRAFRRVGDKRFSRLILTATRLKLIVQDFGDAYLVVATDRHIDLERGLLDIEAAAMSLRKLGRLVV